MGSWELGTSHGGVYFDRLSLIFPFLGWKKPSDVTAEAEEQTVHFGQLSIQYFPCLLILLTRPDADFEKSVRLAGGAGGDPDTMKVLARITPRRAFSEVGDDGNSRPADLPGYTVSLGGRECTGGVIHEADQIHALAPCVQLL